MTEQRDVVEDPLVARLGIVDYAHGAIEMLTNMHGWSEESQPVIALRALISECERLRAGFREMADEIRRPPE